MSKLFFSIILLLAAQNSFAVVVANCPKTINVSYNWLQTLSDSELYRAVGTRGDTPTSEKMPRLREVRDAIKNLPVQYYADLRFYLRSTERSKCDYSPKNVSVPGGETRLFTRNGRDILRVAIHIGKHVVWVYHNVSSYSKRGVEINDRQNESGILAYFDHGSPIYYVGSAHKGVVR